MIKYRVKKISEHEYIPQYRPNIFTHWYSLDVEHQGEFYLHEWNSEKYALSYCVTSNIFKAWQVINEHKDKKESEKLKKKLFPKFFYTNPKP